MAVWNIQSRGEKVNWLQKIIGVLWMFSHDQPFLFAERIGLKQDAVWNPHLADIVQQTAPADITHLRVCEVEFLSQGQGQFRDAQGMTLRFLIPQVEGARPAFDGGIVGLGKLPVRGCQVCEQGCVLNGDGYLPRQYVKKIDPFCIRMQAGTMEYFKYPFDIIINDERYSHIRDEA